MAVRWSGALAVEIRRDGELDRVESRPVSKKLGSVQRVVLKQSYYVVYFVQETARSVVIAVLDGGMIRSNDADLFEAGEVHGSTACGIGSEVGVFTGGNGGNGDRGGEPGDLRSV